MRDVVGHNGSFGGVGGGVAGRYVDAARASLAAPWHALVLPSAEADARRRRRVE